MGKSSAAAKTAASYIVVNGMAYPSAKGEVYAAPGDVIPDPKKGLPALPESSVPWLIEQGHIIAQSQPDDGEATDETPVEDAETTDESAEA